MSSDWDEEEKDQTKDTDKDYDPKQPQTSSSFSTVMTITLKPPKPFITKYFDSMSSKIPIIYIPKEKCRHDTIVAQQELNITECEILDQDSLKDIN